MNEKVATIDGIKIFFYNGEHRPPHFHAVYNEFDIELGTLRKIIETGLGKNLDIRIV